MTSSILLIDDEKNIRLMASTLLTKAGYHVVPAESAEQGLMELEKTVFGLVLVDYMLPGIDGMGFIEHVCQQAGNSPPIVIMTAFGSIDLAVAAMKAGAVDYMAKPFTGDELLHTIQRNLVTASLQQEVLELRSKVAAKAMVVDNGLIIRSEGMKRLFETAELVADNAAPVMIEGETGTGKERVARYIHDRSERAKERFVAVNCGALHPELLLSELFGHRKGAFTGAMEDRVGRFEAAHKGTLFLDEIGELDEGAQVKLLRVLQEGTFERVGETRTVHVNVRIIAATNRRLEEMMKTGTFRSDLYYRLAVIPLFVPPLRQRREEIMPMAEEFLREFAREAGRPELHWNPGALELLANADWPGNVRELRNIVQRCVALTSRDRREIEYNPIPSNAILPVSGDDLTFRSAANQRWSLERLEVQYLQQLIQTPSLTNADICEILQIDSSTLWRKKKKYNLS